MTHSRSWDVEIAPSCDIFNLGSSYFHVLLAAVRHLLNVHCESDNVSEVQNRYAVATHQ